MAKPTFPIKADTRKTTNRPRPEAGTTVVITRTLWVFLSIISISVIIFIFNFFTGGLHNFLLDQHKFVREKAAPVVLGRTQAQSLFQQYVHDVRSAGVPVIGQPLSVGDDICERESHSYMSNPNLSNFSFSCRIDQDIYIASSIDKCSVSAAMLATNKYSSNKKSCSQDGGQDSFTRLNPKLHPADTGPILLDNTALHIIVQQTSDFKRGAAIDLSSDTSGVFVSCHASTYLSACKEIGSREEYRKFVDSLPADTQSVIDVNAADLFYYIQH